MKWHNSIFFPLEENFTFQKREYRNDKILNPLDFHFAILERRRLPVCIYMHIYNVYVCVWACVYIYVFIFILRFSKDEGSLRSVHIYTHSFIKHMYMCVGVCIYMCIYFHWIGITHIYQNIMKFNLFDLHFAILERRRLPLCVCWYIHIQVCIYITHDSPTGLHICDLSHMYFVICIHVLTLSLQTCAWHITPFMCHSS